MADIPSIPLPPPEPALSQLFYEEEDGEDAEHSDSQRLLTGQDASPVVPHRNVVSRRRAFFIRALALLCACSLSIGSH
jgi:hypothetical protein